MAREVLLLAAAAVLYASHFVLTTGAAGAFWVPVEVPGTPFGTRKMPTFGVTGDGGLVVELLLVDPPPPQATTRARIAGIQMGASFTCSPFRVWAEQRSSCSVVVQAKPLVAHSAAVVLVLEGRVVFRVHPLSQRFQGVVGRQLFGVVLDEVIAVGADIERAGPLGALGG